MMDLYSTHIPLLALFVSKSKGKVLELGSGYYSTYLLDALCINRQLVTVEQNLEWLDKFKQLESPRHILINEYDIYNHKWGLVFVDNAPVEDRSIILKGIKDIADYVIVHDTEDSGYQYEYVLCDYKYRYDYKRLCPWTTVVSNKFNVSNLCL
jgi:hypothetical protein